MLKVLLQQCNPAGKNFSFWPIPKQLTIKSLFPADSPKQRLSYLKIINNSLRSRGDTQRNPTCCFSIFQEERIENADRYLQDTAFPIPRLKIAYCAQVERNNLLPLTLETVLCNTKGGGSVARQLDGHVIMYVCAVRIIVFTGTS